MYELIRASAGSGKTFQLSGHFLRQLFAGQAPQTILATTFTRKAAGEILGRVLTRIAKAAQDADESSQLAEFLAPVEVTQQKSQQLLAELTKQLHQMKICTLDSFFQQLARGLTLELGLPPGWSIIDDHTERKIRQQAIDAVLAQQMPRDAQRLFQMLARGDSKRSVRDLIDDRVQKFHELYQLTDAAAWQKIPRPDRLNRADIESAAAKLLQYAHDMDGDGRLVKAIQADAQRALAGHWEAFVKNGVAKKIQQQEWRYHSTALPDDLIEIYEPLLTHTRAELLDIVAAQTQATWKLIDRFDREFTRLRSEQGWMRFNDVTRTLSRAGRAANSDRVQFRLDSALRHLLLDEFQDTSPDQWAVLKRLALKISEGGDQTSFFCVGDPKQAIYGWRGGVAEILDAVEDAIPGIYASSLDKSRRSSRPVIDTVNRVFQHLHQHENLGGNGPAIHGWQQQYPIHSTVKEDVAGYTTLRSSPFFEGSAHEKRIPYLRWVATYLRDLQQQSPGAEIGVLTRKNSTVARLVHELRQLGVAASEEGGTPPHDSPAALAVLSLLHLASHPGCEVSRFHIANCPLSAVTRLTDWQDHSSAVRFAADFRSQLMDDGYGRTLQRLTDAIESSCSRRDLMRLQQIVAQGWLFDETPSLNPEEFIRLLKISRLNKTETAAVRVMTVHQSKGLEFDVVVLPELDGKLFLTPSAAAGTPTPGESPDRVCIWRNATIQSLLPKPLQAAFQQTVKRSVSEALCLLYVALTRAVHGMHLLIPPITSDKTPASFAGLLTAALTEDRLAPADSVLFETGDSQWFQQYSHMLQPQKDTPTSPIMPQIHLSNMAERKRGLRREAPSHHEAVSLDLPALIKAGQAKQSSQHIDPRIRGTIIHEWFEQIDWLNEGNLPSADRLLQLSQKYHVDEHQGRLLLREFQAMVQRPGTRYALSPAGTFHQPEFANLDVPLTGTHAELQVHAERPFVIRRNGALVQGTIDRLVIFSHNGVPRAADIIDFKTDAMYGDQDAWVADKIGHYSSQLIEYQAAVGQCFRIPSKHISARLLLLEADLVVSPHNQLTPEKAG